MVKKVISYIIFLSLVLIDTASCMKRHKGQDSFEEDSKSSSVTALPTGFDLLPNELLSHMASFLSQQAFGRFNRLSKRTHAIGTSPSLVLAQDPEGLKNQILSHQSVDELYFKAQRTQDGFKRLALGFQLLADDTDKLKLLAHSRLGPSRLLSFLPLILKADPSQVDTFKILLNKTRDLWEEEVKKESPLAQFNYGILQLGGWGVNGLGKARELLEKAAQNGFYPAYHALGLAIYLAGHEEEGHHLMDFGIDMLVKHEKDFLREHYGNLIEIVLGPFCLSGSREAICLAGVRALMRKSFTIAAKLLGLAANNGSHRAKMGLAKLFSKTGHVVARDFWRQQAAEDGNIDAQIKLAQLCFKAGHYGKSFTWLARVREKDEPLTRAVLASKIVKFVVAQNDPNPLLLAEVKRIFLRAAKEEDIDHIPFIANIAKVDRAKVKEWIHSSYEGMLAKIVNHGSKLTDNGEKEKAKTWWLFAAQFDHPVAQNNLGTLAEKQGNLEEAKTWYFKAASKGYGLAFRNITEMGYVLYSKGEKERAKELWRLAAQFDYPDALYPDVFYKLCFAASEPDDFEKARNWLVKEAEKGSTIAILQIADIAAELYAKGRKKEGEQWWALAAKFNYPIAQFNLGCFAKYEGNFEEAKSWFAQAAKNGDVDAIRNIKAIAYDFYNKGKIKEAEEWWALAAQFDDKLSQMMNDLSIKK